MDLLHHQTPRVFVKNGHQYWTLYVDRFEQRSSLSLFQCSQQERHERSLIPVFKNEVDARRFDRCAVRSTTHCYALDQWKTNDTYPMEPHMSHLSVSASIRGIPRYLWNECELYDIVPFDLHDMDLVLSLSLKANVGFFVVGTFHVLGNRLSMNGVVVDPSLQDHFSDHEHLTLMQTTYEDLYLD